jgi:small-conductance mechanosensitive channel
VGEDKTYLIQILLEARERVSQVAQKVAQQLDKVAKAQDDVNDATRRMNASQRQQYETLQQLVAAHTREKKALEDSSAVLRRRCA